LWGERLGTSVRQSVSACSSDWSEMGADKHTHTSPKHKNMGSFKLLVLLIALPWVHTYMYYYVRFYYLGCNSERQ
jgi:hypothetical protein